MDRTKVALLARRAADLLPEPPPGDDGEGLLAWTELVGHTVSRLAEIGGVAPLVDPAALPPRRLVAEELLVLAGVPVFVDLHSVSAVDLSTGTPAVGRGLVPQRGRP